MSDHSHCHLQVPSANVKGLQAHYQPGSIANPAPWTGSKHTPSCSSSSLSSSSATAVDLPLTGKLKTGEDFTFSWQIYFCGTGWSHSRSGQMLLVSVGFPVVLHWRRIHWTHSLLSFAIAIFHVDDWLRRCLWWAFWVRQANLPDNADVRSWRSLALISQQSRMDRWRRLVFDAKMRTDKGGWGLRIPLSLSLSFLSPSLVSLSTSLFISLSLFLREGN